MRLIELNPRWVGSGGEGISNADGSPAPERHGVAVSFDCPCGQCGTRAVIMMSNPLDGGTRFPDDHHYWERTGDTFDTLKLTPSIQRVGGCGWHGFVGKDIPGEVTKA